MTSCGRTWGKRGVLSKRPVTSIDDPRYVRALTHPMRVRILAILEERTASPRELAQMLGTPLGNTAYHVRTLHQLGLLKLVKTTRVRGAIQHHYRALERPRVATESWDAAAPVAKQAVVGATVQQIHEYVRASAAAGGFDGPDAHLIRTALKLDEQGFKQLAKAYGRLQADIAKVQESQRKRLEKGASEDELIDVGAVAMLFEALPFSRQTRDSNHDGAATGARSRKRGKAKAKASR
jgi:DNA-binding transcriptional ArsR family regulator